MKLEKIVQQLESAAGKIVDKYFEVPKNVRNKGLRVTVSTSILVPKPFVLDSNGHQWREKKKLLKKLKLLNIH